MYSWTGANVPVELKEKQAIAIAARISMNTFGTTPSNPLVASINSLAVVLVS
jgi:hypothetical protein